MKSYERLRATKGVVGIVKNVSMGLAGAKCLFPMVALFLGTCVIVVSMQNPLRLPDPVEHRTILPIHFLGAAFGALWGIG